ALLTISIAACAFFFAPSSHASDVEVSAAALLGYGVDNLCGADPDRTCTPFGVGLGLRAGVTMPFKLYVGATFLYHLGYSIGSGDNLVREHTFYPGLEAGYDFVLGPITLRPYTGIGDAFDSSENKTSASSRFPAGDTGTTEQRLAVWPGLVALASFHRLFAGIDFRYVTTTQEDRSAPCVFGRFGIRIY
ncbi:MAG: hypothetical protein ACREJX_09280, partial [Polyangiaceae bacterium]